MVYNGYYIILRLDLNCWVPVKPWNLKSNREVNSYENPGKKNSDWPKHENLEITVFIAWWTGSFTCWYNLWYHMGTIGIWRTDPKYLFSAKDILQSQQSKSDLTWLGYEWWKSLFARVLSFSTGVLLGYHMMTVLLWAHFSLLVEHWYILPKEEPFVIRSEIPKKKTYTVHKCS